MKTNQPTNDMHGKVVLITGGSGGIGKETALGLARLGAEVVITGRNPKKTKTVVEQIQAQSGNSQVTSLIADLSLMQQVRSLASDFRANHDRLDVLINNAGAIFQHRERTAEGLEKTFALIHLAPFLLTNLLLDLLIASAPARIITVSSGAHRGARIHFGDLQMQHGLWLFGYPAYRQSKLANILFTYELSRRLQGTGVTANVLHPGFVATNFARNNGGIYGLAVRLSQIGALSPQEGAQTSIYLASSPEVEGVTGKYFVRKEAVPSSSVSYDEEDARRLWEESLKLTGLKEQEVHHAPA